METVSHATSIGTNLLIPVVKATGHGIQNSINYINSSDKTGIEHLKFELELLDINSKITIITAFLNDISSAKISESGKTALIAVENVLSKINCELMELNKRMDGHNSKWFSSYRNLDYLENLNNVKKYNLILDMRLKLLFKVLKMGELLL